MRQWGNKEFLKWRNNLSTQKNGRILKNWDPKKVAVSRKYFVFWWFHFIFWIKLISEEPEVRKVLEYGRCLGGYAWLVGCVALSYLMGIPVVTRNVRDATDCEWVFKGPLLFRLRSRGNGNVGEPTHVQTSSGRWRNVPKHVHRNKQTQLFACECVWVNMHVIFGACLCTTCFQHVASDHRGHRASAGSIIQQEG